LSTINNSLTDVDVRQIASLIESLDKSGLDFLQIDADGVKVTISKSGALPAASAPAAAPAPASVAAQAPARAATSAAVPAQAAVPAPAPAPAAAAVSQDGTLTINAPLLGRFYSKPDPASPAFVTVGSSVDVETPVGLIEVMKLFNTVQAGVRGTITEVCVPDGEFIEYGTAIFRVRPH
jgi:acetyl-CoA carboxylase biotin carboxyl carrier protein